MTGGGEGMGGNLQSASENQFCAILLVVVLVLVLGFFKAFRGRERARGGTGQRCFFRPALSRNHAVGQASRLSLTLNDRPEALFSKLIGRHREVRGNFLDGDRRDAHPTQAGAFS
jgi:hypothetical protein